MANRKRTTKEEKYNLLLSLFKETEDVYHLKELEKDASSKKGLAMNIVKETLQRLVDDGQVEEGKIGNQVYYWRFESKATQEKQTELDDIIEKINQKQQYLNELEDKLSKINPSDYANIEEDMREKEELNKKIKAIEEKIKENSKSGEAEELVKEANEWTDNIFLIKSYVTKKLNMDSKQLDKQFRIPQDLDYI